ncbi:acetylserotonin O-methyltransferase [Argonema antarcticum]|uniref:acetylserotonin O-methyltransferase n=1 Tax=Argonema antarcticum TaxID=2942763 RepID=UPI002013A9DE|nr:acetylserotonin O-methyltransferase [Argonema antarcticum]MCL1472483.1 methyltransferase [Argonema antarcticum A004/B2]
MTLYSENSQTEGESSSSVLLEMMYGYQKSQAIFVATKLGIADILNNGSKTADELAEATGVDSRSIYHLMRMLVSVGVFSVENNDKFQLNNLGKHLLTGTSDSLRGTVMAMGDELYQAWGNLLPSIKSGETAFESTFKMSLYSYFKQNYEASVNFNEWMKETTREWLLPVLEAYDFSEVKTLVDVGGGIGTLTAVILKANPQMQAILFDREDVVVDADKVLEVAGVADRCRIVGGNFFDSVPSGGDLYLLSRVLLNWDDTHAIKILQNCYQAMTAKDKLVVVDFMLPQGKMSPFIGMGSLTLFVLGGNFMRREDEFYNLLSSAGFKVTNTIETKGPVSAIEAKPA